VLSRFMHIDEFAPQITSVESMPLREATSELSVEPLTNGRSKVTWGTDFRPKYGPFGWLLGQTVMKRMMGGIIDGNLTGLAEKVQSDRTADPQPN
jgi:Polyketide cyclase / dehydrase and lipid transport